VDLGDRLAALDRGNHLGDHRSKAFLAPAAAEGARYSIPTAWRSAHGYHRGTSIVPRGTRQERRQERRGAFA